MVDVPPAVPGATPNAGARYEDVAEYIPQTGILAEYCWYGARITDAPAVFHVASILPVLAYEANHWDITNDAIAGPFQWWTLLVGPSGSRKSSAIHTALNFAGEALWLPRSVTPSPALNLAGSAAAIIVQLREHYQDRARDRVAAVLYRDEFSEVLRRDADTEPLVELWDSRTINKHLRSEQKQHAKTGNAPDPNLGRLPNPRVAGIFATTPAALSRVVTPAHREGGLFARLGFIRAQQRKELLDPLTLSHTEAQATQASALQAWNGWTGWLTGERAGGAAMVVHTPVHVKQIATNMFFEPYRAEIAGSEVMGGILTRAFNRVLQLASLYALSRCSWEVDDDDMMAAVNFTNRMLHDTRAIYATLHDDPEMRDVARIHEAFERAEACGGQYLRLSQLISLSGLHRRRAICALEHLVDAGQLKMANVGGGARGRPTTSFCLTPLGQTKLQQLTETIEASPTAPESSESSESAAADLDPAAVN